MVIRRRRLIQIIAEAPLLAVGACALPGGAPPPREFRVTAKSTFSKELPKVEWSLVIDRPSIDRSIDTARIARMDGVEVERYADATWVDRPAAMIEPLIIQSFRNSEAIDVVAGRRSDVRPDFMLQTNIEAFQAQQTDGGPLQAWVVMSASLMAMPRRTVVGTTEIGHSIPANAGDLPSIATAIDEALGKVLKRLIEWTLVTGQAARKGS